MLRHLIGLVGLALTTSAFFYDCGSSSYPYTPPPATLYLEVEYDQAGTHLSVSSYGDSGPQRVGSFDWTLPSEGAAVPEAPEVPAGWQCEEHSGPPQVWIACFTTDQPITIPAAGTLVLGAALGEHLPIELVQVGTEFGTSILEAGPSYTPVLPTPTFTPIPQDTPVATPSLPTVVVGPE